MADGQSSDDQKINDAVAKLQQGDCFVGDFEFLYLKRKGLLSDSAEDEYETEIHRGYVLLSQTCDVVREISEKQFLEICPLVEVENDKLRDIERFRRPDFAYLPGVSKQNMVAYLDQVMTIDKSLVVDADFVRGCNSDQELRNFGRAIARKRNRFAFPDDFNSVIAKLRKKMLEKSSKSNEDGAAIRSLLEIRVKATPDWTSEKVDLFFVFLRDHASIEKFTTSWDVFLERWLGYIEVQGRYVAVNGQVGNLENFTARDYFESDLLDLSNMTPEVSH